MIRERPCRSLAPTSGARYYRVGTGRHRVPTDRHCEELAAHLPVNRRVDQVERSGSEERIRIWVTANSEAKTWTSRRRLDPETLCIEFRQKVSHPPVGAMGDAWVVEQILGTESTMRLLHDYRAVDDNPDKLAWIDRVVDRNSTADLAALKANAELSASAENLSLSFEDAVHVDDAAKNVYDSVNEAQRWSERLPHVARVSL
jgi:aromatase